MATSQNGYPAGNRSLIHNPAVPGTPITFPGGVRKGPAGDLLIWVATQLHHRVENGGTGYGMWGYAYRAIRGATSLSNHASGTAIDWHAPRHPLGKVGTFNAAQVREIRKILAEAQHCIRWGGDYTGRKDEMHFEVVASEAACARALAAVAGGGSSPAPAPTVPPAEKGLPLMIDRPLVKGYQEGRIICPTGSSSSLVSAAWVSASIEKGGRVEMWFQKGQYTDGPPPGAGKPVDWTLKNGDRAVVPIPNGTEYIYYRVTANGVGALLIEQKAK